MGFLLAVAVHSAGIQDTNGAYFPIMKLVNLFPKLKLIWADSGYKQGIIDWAKSIFGWTIEVIKRSDDIKGFKIVPKRWIVERTFAWISNNRRMSKDYEHETYTSESLVYASMVKLMLRRLRKS